MPCSDRYSMHINETGLENNLCVEFWTFSAGGDQQPATADSGCCPGRCECRQLSSPMCHSAMWGWGPLCAWDGLLHMWMRTRLSWHTVPATCCPHHATGHTNPQICWWQLSPLQWSWHNAKARSELLCFILLCFTCIVPNELITILKSVEGIDSSSLCFPSFYGNLQDSSSVLHTTLDMMGKTLSYNVLCPFLCGKSIPSITLRGLSKSFS